MFTLNGTEDSWFQHFSRLKELTSLSLTISSRHIGYLPAIAACKKIETLRIDTGWGTFEDDTGRLPFLGELPALRHLSIEGQLGSDDFMADVGRASKVESLELTLKLNFDGANGTVLAHLGNLKALRELSLEIDFDEITPDDLSVLSRIKLERLKFVASGLLSPVRNETMASLAKVKSLKHLELSVEYLTAEGLEFTKSLPNLTEVVVFESGRLSAADIEEFRTANPNLSVTTRTSEK